MTRTELELDTINKSVTRLSLSAKIEAYDKVLDILNDQHEMISKVMDSAEAQNIYYSALGERFRKLMDKRNELWCKRFQLQNLIGKVWQERTQAHAEYKSIYEII